MKRLALILLIASVASSCSKKEIVPATDQGLNYYPVTAGHYAVFECDSIVYIEIPRDTFHYRYRVREVLADTFIASDGRVLWRLERFIKMAGPSGSYDSLPWKPKDVWYVDADERRVIVSEENAKFTRLIFPVSAGAIWNGNAANSQGKMEYSYSYIDQPESIGAFYFDKTLKVIQRDFRTLISYDFRCEKYARGAGLVYRELREVYSNNIDPAIPVDKRIERGVIFTQTLIAHGNE